MTRGMSGVASVAMLVAAVALSGCGVDGRKLEGTWKSVAMEAFGIRVPKEGETVRFDKGKLTGAKFTGRASHCETSYTVEGSTLKIAGGPGAGAGNGCPAASLKYEIVTLTASELSLKWSEADLTFHFQRKGD